MSDDVGYDPKLKEAMAEIRAVLDKHDIGGLVSLTSETHAEYGLFVANPSWSMVKWNDDGSFIFQVRKAHPERTDQTAHMLYSHRDTAAHLVESLSAMLGNLERVVDVEHKPFHDFKPHYTG